MAEAHIGKRTQNTKKNNTYTNCKKKPKTKQKKLTTTRCTYNKLQKTLKIKIFPNMGLDEYNM